jgi:hypothetical protein
MSANVLNWAKKPGGEREPPKSIAELQRELRSLERELDFLDTLRAIKESGLIDVLTRVAEEIAGLRADIRQAAELVSKPKRTQIIRDDDGKLIGSETTQ